MKSNRVVTLGEVLMRLSTPGSERFNQANNFSVTYGGSEANVAAGLSNLDIPTTHVTRFPDNDLGRAAMQFLRSFGVDTSYTLLGEERLGLYFLEPGVSDRSSRIIYDRFDSAFAFIKPGEIDWPKIFLGASWFHWSGITPSISQAAADVCLEAVSAARQAGLTVSGDINYRRNLWRYGKAAREVMPALISKTQVLVAGSGDLKNSGGIEGETLEESCRSCMKEFPQVTSIAFVDRQIVSSSHNRIKGLLWNGKTMLESRTYELNPIVDRIGAGDAFMAGLIYGQLNDLGVRGTLDFATACCALKHTIPGDVLRVTRQEVEALIQGSDVGKLLR